MISWFFVKRYCSFEFDLCRYDEASANLPNWESPLENHNHHSSRRALGRRNLEAAEVGAVGGSLGGGGAGVGRELEAALGGVGGRYSGSLAGLGDEPGAGGGGDYPPAPYGNTSVGGFSRPW